MPLRSFDFGVWEDLYLITFIKYKEFYKVYSDNELTYEFFIIGKSDVKKREFAFQSKSYNHYLINKRSYFQNDSYHYKNNEYYDKYEPFEDEYYFEYDKLGVEFRSQINDYNLTQIII